MRPGTHLDQAWRQGVAQQSQHASFGGPFSNFSYFRQFPRIFERIFGLLEKYHNNATTKIEKVFFENLKTCSTVSVMMPKHSPKVMGWTWKKVGNLNFWGPDPIGCIWTLYVWSGDMISGLRTWYMVFEHDIWSSDMICGLRTWYMVFGHDIWSSDMIYGLRS